MTNDVIGSINNYETLHINDRISAIMVKINQIEQNVVDNSRFDRCLFNTFTSEKPES